MGRTRRASKRPCPTLMPRDGDVLVRGVDLGPLTEHGGGLTDAMVFGRIAGAEAATQ